MPKESPAMKRETSAAGVAVAVIARRGSQVGVRDSDMLVNLIDIGNYFAAQQDPSHLSTSTNKGFDKAERGR